MDRTPALKATVAIIVCCFLLSINDVSTLPLQLCRPLINYIDSLASSGQSIPADHLPIYLDCLGVQRLHLTDDSAVRQLLQLQPNSTFGSVDDVQAPPADTSWWSNVPAISDDELCVTVDCLGRRAGLTFEPCSRLTQTQCIALVSVLEHITSDADDADHDDVDAAARLLEHFRILITQYRKWRQNHVISAEQSTETEKQKANKKYKRNTESVSKFNGNSEADKSSGMTSSQVTSAARGARMRRSATVRLPFQLPRKMTPETRAIIQAYLEWRKKNGYGRISGRWG